MHVVVNREEHAGARHGNKRAEQREQKAVLCIVRGEGQQDSEDEAVGC